VSTETSFHLSPKAQHLVAGAGDESAGVWDNGDYSQAEHDGH
jgi:hypothetical protein